MTKKYKSKSCISINVVLDNGKYIHISFVPMTRGGSVYYTSDKAMQSAIERHPYYGTMIKGEIEVATDSTIADTENSATAEEQTLVISVKSIDEAKDYLSEKFNVSRTKLRGIESVKNAATANGVVFEGI